MGIYIPNEEMPKSCVKCRWYYELYDEHCTLGKFLLRKYPTDVSEEPYILDTQRHPDCPLEEVDDIAFGLYKAYMDGIEPSDLPKGARLIDANAIYIGRWDIDTDLADQILNAPTILESEVMPK